MLINDPVEAVDSSSTDLTPVIMMLLLPNFRICSRASLLAPSPTASMATTLPTPKTTPSIVREERSLWSKRFSMPRETLRRNLFRFPRFPLYSLDKPVPHVEFFLGKGGNMGLMGYHNDGLSLLIQLGEQFHDLLPCLG